MRIKKFHSDNIRDALKMVRDELGPDAMIISSKEVLKDKGVFGKLTKPMIEVTASSSSYIDNKSRSDSLSLRSKDESYQIEPLIDSMIAMAENISNYNETVLDFKKRFEDLEDQLSDLKSLLLILTENSLDTRRFKLPLNYRRVAKFLESRKISPEFAMTIVEDIYDKAKSKSIKPDTTELMKFARKSLETLIVTDKTFHLDIKSLKRQRIILLVGAAGVGKSSMILKLACKLAEDGFSSSILNIDKEMIGKESLIKTYADIFNIFSKSVYLDDLDRNIERLKDKDYIFIDTSGQSLTDISYIAKLKLLSDKNKNIEIYLVVTASSSEESIAKAINLYEPLSLRSMLVTKLDEADFLGHIFNQTLISGISLSYFGTGQNIPLDIEAMTSSNFVKRMLNIKTSHTKGVSNVKVDEREYQQIK